VAKALKTMYISFQHIKTHEKQLAVIPNSQMFALSADSYSQVLSEIPLSNNAEYIESATLISSVSTVSFIGFHNAKV